MEKLDTIADIQIGFTARGKLESMDGGVRAIQLRDTTPDGEPGLEPIGRFRLDDVPDRYQVRTGDIVFRSRGDRNTALILGADFDEPAIAVMPLVIIRPHPRVLPHYLAWYINEPPAQRHFEKGARGTGMRMIPISCLASLEVPVPALNIQRAISTIEGIARREFQIATQLAAKRQQLITAALLRSAHESVHNQQANNTTVALRPAEGAKP